MKSVVRTLFTLALAIVIASPLLAAEGKKGKKKEAKPQDPAAQLLKSLEKAELTADQVAKIKELAAACAEKVKAIEEKAGLTPEQKKARQEAQAKAKADGKKGKEAMEAVMAAMNLSDAQKAAMKEVDVLRTALRKEALALLSAEQKAKADIKEPGKRAKKQ
jgi:hypothetical protein